MLLNGVRRAAIARARDSGGAKKKGVMPIWLRESFELISDPGKLDAAVAEVFQLMLGLSCQRQPGPAPVQTGESVTAVVGFGGALSGACVFRSESSAAVRIAGNMTGMEFALVDDTVKDAIGEICNMLTGDWKGKVPELSASCGLSVPAVIAGCDYNLHVQAPEFQLQHVYAFGGSTFAVTIVCDGLQ
jgi:chemotaxis protein CheX